MKTGGKAVRQGMRKQDLGVWLLALGTAALGAALLGRSQAAAEGARLGLAACGTTLIPALFPFLALSVFVAATPVSDLLTGPVGKLTGALYGAPRVLGPAVLLSWIGGYPAGAKVLAEQLEQGVISPEDAELALCFCVNSGPAFMTGVVGAGVFGSASAGLGLFGCQLLAGAVGGRLMLRGRRFSPLALAGGGRQGRREPLSAALVRSVTGAAASMLAMCAFVVFFSTLAALLRACGVLPAASGVLSALSGGILTPRGAEGLLTGMLEVCGGSTMAGSLPPEQAALALPFVLSFSSLSVICQVASCFPPGRLKMGMFLRSRFLHGLLTAALASPWLWQRARTAGAFASGSHVLAGDGRTAAGTVCLLGMCAILFLTIEGRGEQPPR